MRFESGEERAESMAGQARERARAPLGAGLRLAELYLLGCLAMVCGYALVVPPDDFAYGLTFFWTLAVGCVSTFGVWLIERRARATRRFVPLALGALIGLCCLDLALGGGLAALAQAPAAVAVVVDGIYLGAGAAVMVYLACSKAARATLTAPLKGAARVADDGFRPKALTWGWWRDLGVYYCVGSIVGHWGEIAFCWLIVLGVFDGTYDFSHAQLWSQWLYPYPAEGVAMVLVVVALYPLKERIQRAFKGRFLPTLVVSFLVIMAVCAAVDFTTGITANADYQLWDYRDMPFNFMGQVVLQNTLAYSAIATVVVWVVFPALGRWFAQLGPTVMDGIFFCLVGGYAFLEVLYFVHLTPAGIVFG